MLHTYIYIHTHISANQDEGVARCSQDQPNEPFFVGLKEEKQKKGVGEKKTRKGEKGGRKTEERGRRKRMKGNGGKKKKEKRGEKIKKWRR